MQIFPRSLNKLPVIAAVVTIAAVTGLTFLIWYYFSPKNTQVGYAPRQPVPYSHRLHAGQLGIDCRYCHTNVERSAWANVPDTETCMNCHQLVRTDSARLAPVRESWATGEPIPWIRVHRLPDHAYFDHSVHVTAGVGCVSCHGRIDQMDVVRQHEPLNMGWCLECHRDPNGNDWQGLPRLRPRDQVTNMTWRPDPNTPVAHARPVEPPQQCSGCHR
jgi:hypothetical protein